MELRIFKNLIEFEIIGREMFQTSVTVGSLVLINAFHIFYLHKLFGVGVSKAFLEPHINGQTMILLSFRWLYIPLA